jgi:hypothetical protein
LEIEKVKMLNGIDNIIGISEVDILQTLNFIEEQKITNISIIIDKERHIRIKNNFHDRFEAIVEDDVLLDYKNDPTVNSMIYEYATFAYFGILCLVIGASGINYCLKRTNHYKDFIKYYSEISNSNKGILASKKD